MMSWKMAPLFLCGLMGSATCAAEGGRSSDAACAEQARMPEHFRCGAENVSLRMLKELLREGRKDLRVEKDDRGRVVKVEKKELEGGFARAAFSYDGQGNMVRAEYFDEADVRLGGFNLGLAGRMDYRYDSGNRLTRVDCYGPDDKPVMCPGQGTVPHAYASMCREYGPEGRLKEIRYLDDRGNLISREMNAYARILFHEDVPSRTRTMMFLHADGSPGGWMDGADRVRFSYDGRGRETSRICTDERGEMITGKDCANFRYQYDEQDNLLETVVLPEKERRGDVAAEAGSQGWLPPGSVRKLTPLTQGDPAVSLPLMNGVRAPGKNGETVRITCTLYGGKEGNGTVRRADFVNHSWSTVSLLFPEGAEWFRVRSDSVLCLAHGGKSGRGGVFLIRVSVRGAHVTDLTEYVLAGYGDQGVNLLRNGRWIMESRPPGYFSVLLANREDGSGNVMPCMEIRKPADMEKWVREDRELVLKFTEGGVFHVSDLIKGCFSVEERK